jgi:hypothetical protein
MYKALKDLNNTSNYANAALAWASFIDLRAKDCKTVREYLSKFRESIFEIAQQGINIT